MELGYRILQKQKQIFTQKQVQSLNVLAMDNVELNSFMQNEYLENPMLEYQGPSGAPAPVTEAAGDQWNQRLEEFEDLKQYLMSQLSFRDVTEKERRVMKYLIECVDDTGYFTMPPKEAAGCLQEDEAVVLHCLEELKCLEPVGVFSESLKECLLKQLEFIDCKDPELRQMVGDHLEDIADGNIGRISRDLGITTAMVRKYILLIESLKPRPAMGFGGRKTEYMIPDIILKYEGGWEIELNDHWMDHYQISDYYLRLTNETNDRELRQYFREKTERIRLILRNIEQRRNTLLRLTGIVLEYQKPYFEGLGGLKSMTMAEAAGLIGVHPSTVTRAVKGKYLQYPKQTVPLKALFTANVSRESGGDVNAPAVKAWIWEWIRGEDKKKPFSDQKLVDLLKEEGISVSRRTVTKYRETMGIKGSFDRKLEETLK